ncbi:methyl-accepting chemotaxis (MCP) signaling domain protein, partial [Vibrio parahaemolyticus V-223/04]
QLSKRKSVMTLHTA